MDPITLVLRSDKLPAFPDPAGAVDLAEHDGNLSALKTAAEQLDAEKLSADAATPVTLRAAELLGTDDFMLLRGGVPYLVAPTVMASYFGTAPAATAPAALAAGQWSAEPTATPGQIGINIAELPNDGGSAIAALEYRVGTGAAVALVGTGTGLRVVTAGFAAGVAADIQVRAVNAADANPSNWSDTKTRTPLAAPAGVGAATWESVASSVGELGGASGGSTPSRPAEVTPSDLLVLSITNITPISLAEVLPPAGWTFVGGGHSDFADGLGFAYYVASGSVADALWTSTDPLATTIRYVMHRISGANLTSPVRQFASSAAHLDGFNTSLNDLPSPSVTASAGDLVLSHYHQPQSQAAVGTPQDGYTRVVDNDDPNRHSVLIRSNAPAGATGTISHNANAGWQARAVATVLIAAA